MKKFLFLVGFLFLLCGLNSKAQIYTAMEPVIQVGGRTVSKTSIIAPTCRVNESGTIRISVWVNPDGLVTRTEVDKNYSTIRDLSAWESCRNAARKLTFMEKFDPWGGLSSGTVTYIFGAQPQPGLTNESREPVLKFMDITVDGGKEQFIAALVQKGFVVTNRQKAMLKGVYNGDMVYLAVHANSANKVDRLLVMYPQCDKLSDAIRKYNSLLDRFGRSTDYFAYLGNCALMQSESYSDEALRAREARFGVKNSRTGYFSGNDTDFKKSPGIVWFYVKDKSVFLFFDNLKNRPLGW